MTIQIVHLTVLSSFMLYTLINIGITLLGPPMDLGFHLQLTINVNKHACNLNLNPMPTKTMSKHCINIQDQQKIIDE
jgi:hypothetical protein